MPTLTAFIADDGHNIARQCLIDVVYHFQASYITKTVVVTTEANERMCVVVWS